MCSSRLDMVSPCLSSHRIVLAKNIGKPRGPGFCVSKHGFSSFYGEITKIQLFAHVHSLVDVHSPVVLGQFPILANRITENPERYILFLPSLVRPTKIP